MEWVAIKYDKSGKKDKSTLPKIPGKYIVETRTSMGNTHRLECNFSGESFSVTNQIVVKWLSE
jgi:hypothetical protein